MTTNTDCTTDRRWKILVEKFPISSKYVGKCKFDKFIKLSNDDKKADLPLFVDGMLYKSEAYCVRETERILKIIEEKGYGDNARSNFSKKLCTDHEIEPTLYEIACAAIMAGVFEPGSMKFEKVLPTSEKNSDIFGMFGDVPVRVEVTRIEEDWPKKCDINEKEIAQTGYVLGEFTIQSRVSPRVREDLGIKTIWDIELVPPQIVGNEDDISTVRATPSPQATCFGGNPSSPLHRDAPPASKFYSDIQKKLEQCEEGCINIIVVGNPSPPNDDSLRSALRGQPFASFVENEIIPCRYLIAPFNVFSREELKSENIANTVNLFCVLSAVIGLRVNLHNNYFEILENPNASFRLPLSLKKSIEANYNSIFLSK